MDSYTIDMIHSFIGIIPAIIFPLAALIQFVQMLHKRSAEGVSPLSWGLFGLANSCLFIYTGTVDFVTVLSLLGTAIIDFLIVGVWFLFRGR